MAEKQSYILKKSSKEVIISQSENSWLLRSLFSQEISMMKNK